MKLMCCVLFLFLSFCNYPNVDNSYKTQTRYPSAATAKESYKVSVYEDDKLVAKNFYDKGLLIKQISYNTQTNTEEYISKFFHNKNGKLEHKEVIKKVDNVLFRYFYEKDLLVKSVTHNLETKKDEKIIKYYYNEDGSLKRHDAVLGEDISDLMRPTLSDDIAQTDFLKSKGLKLPFPDLIWDKLYGTSTMLAIGDYKGNDFKKEIQVTGNKKTIRYIGLNKTVHFSSISVGIAPDEIIKDYTLVLKDDFLFKEIYTTGKSNLKRIESGELINKYFYDNNHKLLKVISTSNYIRNSKLDKTSSERRFEYEDLPKQ